ncbi:unnamed protein product [Penicillium glandicola]
MGDRTTRCSATRGSSGGPSRHDTPGFANEPTSTNESTDTDHSFESGPSHWSSYPSIEILRAHLAAGADSDSSEASEPRVHPDFFVHLERLRQVNEIHRVNARRDAEARYQASLMHNDPHHQASHMLNLFHNNQASHMLDDAQNEASSVPDNSENAATRLLRESYNEASRILNESRRGSSRSTDDPNQPSSHASAQPDWDTALRTARERYPAAPRPLEQMAHVRFETPDLTGLAPHRDHSNQHRPPSPYPVATRRQPADVSTPMATRPVPAPERHSYTEHGNPYILGNDPGPFPEGAIPYSPDRILQAWLIRMQLIAGVRPENLQPMSNPRGGRQHRTPPWIVLNDSGAHIVRMEPARFHGVMLPLPALPWLPRRPNPNSSTAPISSNTLDASAQPISPNIATAPTSAGTPNPPVAPHVRGAAALLAALDSPAAPDLLDAARSASAPNPLVGPDLSAATNSPAASHMQAAATLVNARIPPAAPEPFVVSDPMHQLQESLEDPRQHDPRMVAFFQPLRLHEANDSISNSVPDACPERPSTFESGFNVNSQLPGVAIQPQLHAGMPLTVQNRTDADSISSQEVPRVMMSHPHSQDQDSSTVSSMSNEGTETGHVAPPQAPHGNGAVHHAITWSEPENPEEPASPRLRRFVIDGADDLLVVGRSSEEAKPAGDQSSLGGLI